MTDKQYSHIFSEVPNDFDITVHAALHKGSICVWINTRYHQMMAGKYRIILIQKKKTFLVHFIMQIVSRMVKDQENLFRII